MFHKFQPKTFYDQYEIYYVNQHVVDKHLDLYTDPLKSHMAKQRMEMADYVIRNGQLVKSRTHSLENMLDKVLGIK